MGGGVDSSGVMMSSSSSSICVELRVMEMQSWEVGAFSVTLFCPTPTEIAGAQAKIRATLKVLTGIWLLWA